MSYTVTLNVIILLWYLINIAIFIISTANCFSKMIYTIKYFTTTILTFFSNITKRIFKGNNEDQGYPCTPYDLERGQPLDTFPLLNFDEVTIDQY